MDDDLSTDPLLLNGTSECSDQMYIPFPLKILLVSAYFFVGVTSLIGNFLVLLVVILRRQTRTVTNLFISSVSAADLVITFVSLWATPMAFYERRWIFGEVMCYVVSAIQGASLIWAPFTLAAIAVDRYMLVSSPYKPQMSPKTSLLVIIGIWSGAFLVLTPMLEHVGYFQVGECTAFCIEFWEPTSELRLVYGICVLLIRSGLPLIVISFCHWRIATILASHGKKLQERRNTSEERSAADIKRKQRLQKLLLSMVIIFAVSSFPIDLFNVLQDIQLVYHMSIISDEGKNVLFFLCHWIAMAGCLLNPLVYAWHNDNFRAHIKNLFLSKRSSSFKTIVTNASRMDHTHSRIDAGPLNTITLLDVLDKDDVKL
ncbi:npr-7 [Pristionchus pacificus]|uniref:Npr-7 n=1 Tax=Pristionchus pacificus TaxID=54126 RepID=A0A2A6D014_PRIPA|nr:npr-7 [Pristionchus pacificus]|eukprot:PDM83814.1 npr-7 [Pristionchus pacificus]